MWDLLFNKRSLTTYRNQTFHACDLLSTNDLLDNNFPETQQRGRVVICFQQTIFDNQSFRDYNTLVVGFCFQQTIFDNMVWLLKWALLSQIYFQQTIFDNASNGMRRGRMRCDLLSTNDLWQQGIFIASFRWVPGLWFAFQQNDLDNRQTSSNMGLIGFVICFQQTIFDNVSRHSNQWNGLVICFQQTIFDNILVDTCAWRLIVICFQQTIFDNNDTWTNRKRPVVICFQQTIFDNSKCKAHYPPLFVICCKRSLITIISYSCSA